MVTPQGTGAEREASLPVSSILSFASREATGVGLPEAPVVGESPQASFFIAPGKSLSGERGYGSLGKEISKDFPPACQLCGLSKLGLKPDQTLGSFPGCHS